MSKVSERWPGSIGERFTALPDLLLDAASIIGLGPTTVHTLLLLERYSWGGAEPFPALSTLAGQAGVKTRTLRGHMERLENLGLIEAAERFDESGRRTSNRYSRSGLNEVLELIEAVASDLTAKPGSRWYQRDLRRALAPNTGAGAELASLLAQLKVAGTANRREREQRLHVRRKSTLATGVGGDSDPFGVLS
ncbi:MAG TPA: hypothetical protein VN686_07845 [Gaiellales bacterium]|nr:hypothetical protein [Gaiellales bacterium]